MMQTIIRWTPCSVTPNERLKAETFLLTDGRNIGVGHFHRENGVEFFGCDSFYKDPIYYARIVVPKEKYIQTQTQKFLKKNIQLWQS